MTEKKPEFIKRDITAIGKDYASLLKTLKERYRSLQIKTAVTVNTAMLEFYWALGRDLSKMHGQAKWGSSFFDTLSLDLRKEFPDQKGFSTTNLKYAKRWYEFYSQADTIRHQLGDEFKMPESFAFVPWRHHVAIFTHAKYVDELMKQADDNPTIGLLICKSKDNTVVEWSFRGLSRPLGVAEYELNKVVNEVAAKTLPTETELQKLIDTYEV